MSVDLDPAAPLADPPVAAAPAARRRPGLVALLYAYRAVAGLLIALPAAAAVGVVTAHYPRAQAELFDPGGLMLVASLRSVRRAIPVVQWAGGSVTVLAAAIGLFPLAAAIAGLGRSGRLSASFLTARAWAHAGTMAILFGLGALAQVVVAALLMLVGGKLIEAVKVAPPKEDIAFVALIAVTLLVVAVIGVLRDLAYVAAIHGGHRFYVASTRALRALIRLPARAAFAWSWRALLGFAGLAFAAWAAPSLTGAGTAAILAGVLLHQAALAGTAFARASWLAAAIRLVDATAPIPEAAPEPLPAAAEVETPATEAPAVDLGTSGGGE